MFCLLLLVLVTFSATDGHSLTGMPYDYSITDHTVYYDVKDNYAPIRSAVVIINTTISADKFTQDTGIDLPVFSAQYSPTAEQSNRRRRGFCFTIVFYTTCNDNEIAGIKEAMKKQEQQTDAAFKLAMLNKDQVLVLSKATNRISEKADQTVQAVLNLQNETNAQFRTINSYLSASREQHMVERNQDIAFKIKHGLFPTSVLGDGGSKDAFMYNLCQVNSLKDACSWDRSEAPDNMRLLNYGRVGGQVWLVASFNFLPQDHLQLKMRRLNRRVGKECYVWGGDADTVVFDTKMKRSLWYSGARLVMDIVAEPNMRKEALCMAIDLRQAINNMVSTKFTTERSVLDLVDKTEAQYAVDLMLKNCFENTNSTKLAGPSVLVYAGQMCGMYSPAPGMLWDPATSAMQLVNAEVVTVKQDILVAVPELMIPDIKLPKDTIRIDISDWDRQVQAAVSDYVEAQANTKRAIEHLEEGWSTWQIVAVAVGTLALCIVLAIVATKARSMLLTPFLPVALTKAAAQRVEAQLYYITCLNSTGSETPTCPPPGTYKAATVGNKMILRETQLFCNNGIVYANVVILSLCLIILAVLAFAILSTMAVAWKVGGLQKYLKYKTTQGKVKKVKVKLPSGATDETITLAKAGNKRRLVGTGFSLKAPKNIKTIIGLRDNPELTSDEDSEQEMGSVAPMPLTVKSTALAVSRDPLFGGKDPNVWPHSTRSPEPPTAPTSGHQNLYPGHELGTLAARLPNTFG